MGTDLYAEDESKTLCYNWQKLCEAVVAKACADYEMLFHPDSGRTYLRKWRDCNRYDDSLPAWIDLQKKDIEYAFGNGLGELAREIGKYHLIDKVINQTADDENIRKLAREHKLRIAKRVDRV